MVGVKFSLNLNFHKKIERCFAVEEEEKGSYIETVQIRSKRTNKGNNSKNYLIAYLFSKDNNPIYEKTSISDYYIQTKTFLDFFLSLQDSVNNIFIDFDYFHKNNYCFSLTNSN